MSNSSAAPESQGQKGSEDQIVSASFVSRPNRFVVVAQLEGGPEISAYLPNTGRLSHLMQPGRPLLLRFDGGPSRRTEFTVIRAWDDCWVALEASKAPGLLKGWLMRGNPFPGFGRVDEMRSEVAVEGHRLDLLLLREPESMWVEVKSGGRARNGVALLSKTPSVRGASHLATLARLAGSGERSAAAFVLQRGDVDSLSVGGDADPGWVDAVRSAREAGVVVAAFACDVTATDVRIARMVPVTWG